MKNYQEIRNEEITRIAIGLWNNGLSVNQIVRAFKKNGGMTLSKEEKKLVRDLFK